MNEDAVSSDDSTPLSLANPALVSILTGSAVGILGNQSVLPALPDIATAMAISDAQVGLVVTAFYLTTAVAIPFTGAVADLYGRRALFVGSLLLFGIAGLATTLVDTFTMLLVLRGLQGVAFAGVTPITIALIGDLYSGSAGTTAQGLRTSSHGIANVLGPALGGFLAGLSWRLPFLVFFLAFPAAVVAYRYLPSVADDGTTPDVADADGGTDPALPTYLRSVAAELSSPRLLVLVTGVAVVYLVKTALMTFLPLFAVRELGVSSFLAGVLLSLRGGIRVVLSPLSGALTERFTRLQALAAAFACLAAGSLLVSVVGAFWSLVAVYAVYSVGDAFSVPILNDGVTSTTSTANRAGVVSFMNTFKIVANTVAPAAFGLLLSATGFRPTFQVAGAVLLCFAVVLVVVLRASGDPAGASA